MLAFINDTGVVVVVVAVVLLFGASRLPKLARSLGEAGREFRKAHDEANLEPSAISSGAIGAPRDTNIDSPITAGPTNSGSPLAAGAGAGSHPGPPDRGCE